MDYCKVVDSQVVGFPGPLPQTYDNISAFKALSEEALRAHGWYRADGAPPLYDERTHVLNDPSFEVNAEFVQLSWSTTEKPLEAIKVEQIAKLREQVQADILGVAPIYKQLNATVEGRLTQAEILEMNTAVDILRETFNETEAALNASTNIAEILASLGA